MSVSDMEELDTEALSIQGSGIGGSSKLSDGGSHTSSTGRTSNLLLHVTVGVVSSVLAEG